MLLGKYFKKERITSMRCRRLFVAILVATTLTILTGCGSTQTPSSNGNNEIFQANGGSPLHGNLQVSKDAVEKNEIEERTVDIDLTTMSSTVVYAQVSDMMANPSNYLGKIVKMTGTFNLYTNQDQTVFYSTCEVADATACCANGIEFVMPDNGNPIVGEEITVVGRFEDYEEDGIKYVHLVDVALE